MRELLRQQPGLLGAKTSGAGESALHHLAIENALSAVRTLAAAGADVNSQDSSGSTPLMAAARLHLVDMVALLLELGADPRAKNEDSDSALHFASQRGAERIVDLLIKAGADIHARNELGESFLDLALPRKRPKLSDLHWGYAPEAAARGLSPRAGVLNRKSVTKLAGVSTTLAALLLLLWTAFRIDNL